MTTPVRWYGQECSVHHGTVLLYLERVRLPDDESLANDRA